MDDPRALFLYNPGNNLPAGLPVAAYQFDHLQRYRIEDADLTAYTLNVWYSVHAYPLDILPAYHTGETRTTNAAHEVQWIQTNSPSYLMNWGGAQRWTASLKRAAAWQKAKAARP